MLTPAARTIAIAIPKHLPLIAINLIRFRSSAQQSISNAFRNSNVAVCRRGEMVAADTYGATADLIVSMSQPSRGEFARGLANRSSLHMSGERRLAERVEFRPPSPRLRRGLILRRRHPAEARAEFRRERRRMDSHRHPCPLACEPAASPSPPYPELETLRLQVREITS